MIDIIRSPHIGYCFGVKRAMRLIEEGLAKYGAPIYTLGDVIHNPPEVERLRARGVSPAGSIAEVPEGGTLVIRAHGVHPGLLREAERRRIRILDATCPFVRRSQDFARRLAEEGRRVIIVGDPSHPEVQSVAGHAGAGAIIVPSPGEAASVESVESAGVVIQTTFPRPEAERVIEALRARAGDLLVHDTICEATESRRKAALELAKRVDVMLVIGGSNSSNTRRLLEACAGTGLKARLVESPADVDPAAFATAERIGLVTGTSTPDWLIEEVVERLSGAPREGS